MSEERQMTVLDERPMTLERYEAMQAIISQEVPSHAVKRRKGRGGKTFSYVGHAYVTRTLNEALGFHGWSFEALPETLRLLSDGGYGIFVRLTVHLPDGHVVTKVEYGEKEFLAGMLEGDLIKSAVSDGLCRAAMRLGLGLSLYEDIEKLTPEIVLSRLCAYAKNQAGWSPNQTKKFLKGKDYSSTNIVEGYDQAYRDLAEALGKTEAETFEEEPEPEEEPAKDPLVEAAEELGGEAARINGRKINFVKFYELTQKELGMGGSAAKEILEQVWRQTWMYKPEAELLEVLRKWMETDDHEALIASYQ